MTPNEILASTIADDLVTSGLIKDTNKEELFAKLKQGGVRQEDWQLWIDIATSPERPEAEVSNE